VKRGEGNTNLPELSLAYHQAISWPPPWISHLFSQWPSWGSHTILQLGCFGLDLCCELAWFPTGGFCWQVFVFHVYLLYMNMEPHDYFMHYCEAMHVKYAAPVEIHIVKEAACKTVVLTYLGNRWSKDLSDLRRTGATPALLRLMFITENVLEFIYVVSHDLLTAITTSCSMLGM